MSRRRGQKADKRNALISRMRKVPNGASIYTTLIGLGEDFWELSADRDRTCAIMGASYLEYALKKSISLHLKDDPLDPEFDYLFESDEAPYRDFSTRIRLARAIGVLTKDEAHQLNIIRQIRNAFAHSMDNITFQTKEIAAYFEDLKILDDSEGFNILVQAFAPSQTLLGMMPSDRIGRVSFAHAIFLFYWKLINYPKVKWTRDGQPTLP